MADPRVRSHRAEYAAWYNMIARCTKPKHRLWPTYGGRGINVCPEWMTFQSFLADMGFRPGPDFSLDRIDNEKGYEPRNCQWATKTRQSRNTRRNVVLKVEGHCGTLMDLSEKFGVKHYVVRQRLALGWTIEQAFGLSPAPPSQRGGKKRPLPDGVASSKAALRASRIEFARQAS